MSNEHQINTISREDATIVVLHYMGTSSTIGCNETYMKTLARNILRSNKISLKEALIASEANRQGMPRSRAF